MHRVFIPIYRFWKSHKTLMWLTIIISLAVFAFFGLKLSYVEDLTQLLPKTDKAKESGLAFEQLSVKDKIFLEITSSGKQLEAAELAQASDDFIQMLMDKDSSSHLISNVLYRIEDEWMVNGLDYALAHFPSILEPDAYPRFEGKLKISELRASMERNVSLMADDWDGQATQLVCYDPAELRMAMLPQGTALSEQLGGFSVIEGHMFSPDSTCALAFIAPAFKSYDSMSSGKLIGSIRKCKEEFCSVNPGIDILFHGESVLSAGNSGRIRKDLVLTIIISLTIILLAILNIFGFKRGWKTAGAMVLPIIYGSLMSMAIIWCIKDNLSMMSMGIGALVLGIAMSYVLHVLIHHKYVSDPEKVLRDQSTPVCLGCLTTIGAFVGLMFTDSELLSDFGLFASFALVGTTLFSLIFLPQFLNEDNGQRPEKSFAFLEKVNNFRLDRNRPLIIGLGIIAVISIIMSPKVGFDNDMNNIGYFGEDTMKSLHLFEEKVNGNHSSKYFAVAAENFDDALRYSAEMNKTVDSLAKAGKIKTWSSISSILKTNEQQARNIACWREFWSPERVAKTKHDISRVAQEYALDPSIFDQFFAIIEADYEPESIADAGILPVELSCNFYEKTGDKYVVFTSTLIDQEDMNEVCDIISEKPHALVLDPTYYMKDMVKIVRDDFNVVLLISSIFVFLVLLATYRSLGLAILSFLPMGLSWYMVEGIMAIFGLEFNLINIVISSFIFGVGVDYSIFIMDGLLAKARGGDDELLTHHKTAISLSAFILIVVVCSLLLAKHPALWSVGICTLIGMVSTILLSYCIQPFLFRLMLRNKYYRKVIVKK